LKPDDAGAYANRCFSRAIVGQLSLALEDCNESLALRANDAATLNSLGLVHLKLNDAKKAMADYNAVLAMNSAMDSSLYGRGLAKQKLGDAAGAVADMNAAKSIHADIASQFAKWGVAGKP